MQPHVEERELDLAQRLQAGLEVLGRQHLVEQRARQRLAGVDMARQLLDDFPLPAEVLHELAGQLDGVPFDARDAGHAQFRHAGQQVVQAVAAFVEQRRDVVVREQRRLAFRALGEVAHQVRHGDLLSAGARQVGPRPAAAHLVHPGARALAIAGVQVQVDLADQPAVTAQLAELHRLVPDRGLGRHQLHAEQAVDDAEQAVQHARQGQVLPHFLVGEGVARLLQLLGDEGGVPGLQVVHAQRGLGEVAQLVQVALGVGAGAGGQVAQEGQHLGRRAGHLGHQRGLGEVREAQQPGLFLAQHQQFLHQRAVVPLRLVAELAGPRHVGAVQTLAQRAVLGVLHHRHVDGEVQRQLVGVRVGVAVLLRGGARVGDDVGGNALELGRRHDRRPAVGGVHHVLGEGLAEFGAALLDLGEARLGLALELGAGQDEVADRMLEQLGALGRQAGLRGDRLVLGVQRLVGAQGGVELGHRGQHRVVGLAQRWRVGHRVQVAHGAPGGAQALGSDVQGAGQELVVGRRAGRGDLVQRLLRLGEQFGDGRLDVRRLDRGEVGQRRGREQGVRGGGGAGGGGIGHAGLVSLTKCRNSVSAFRARMRGSFLSWG